MWLIDKYGEKYPDFLIYYPQDREDRIRDFSIEAFTKAYNDQLKIANAFTWAEAKDEDFWYAYYGRGHAEGKALIKRYLDCYYTPLEIRLEDLL